MVKKTAVNKSSESKSEFYGLIGKKVLFMCSNYFYVGVVVSVDDFCVHIKDPCIVYETGAWTNANYSDIQSLCVEDLRVTLNSIESFCLAK